MTGGTNRPIRVELDPGDAVEFMIRGICMQPLVDGQRVRVVGRRWYLPGDLVVARRADHWSAHRFLGYTWSRQGWAALTRADHASGPDPACSVRSIVGALDEQVPARDRFLAGFRYLSAVLHQALRAIP